MIATAVHPSPRRLSRRLALLFATLAVALVGYALPAVAAAAPEWDVSTAYETRFAPGGNGTVAIAVENTGDTATDGTGALDVTLPAGMTGASLFFQTPGPVLYPSPSSNGGWTCSDPTGVGTLHCDFATVLQPGEHAELVHLKVAVPASASGHPTAQFQMSGGGAATVSVNNAFNASALSDFGIDRFDGSVEADPTTCPAGQTSCSFTQAGGHPYAVSTSFSVNTRDDPVFGDYWPDEPLKNVFVAVPPGLIGNPEVVEQCTLDELIGSPETNEHSTCPPAAQVGVATVTLPACPAFPLLICAPFTSFPVPIYSLVSPPDVPARFGFVLASTVVTLDAELRSGTDYGLSINVKNTSEALPIIGTTVTLWGTPADDVHTPERQCPATGNNGCGAGVPPRAFMTLPTSCKGPQVTTLRTDSWFHPGIFKTAQFTSHRTRAEGGAPQGATNCGALPFDPEISLQPTSHEADSPTGLSVDLSVPQDQITDPGAIAQSHLRKAVVTLPAGMSVNPSSADGLGACSSAQIDLHSSSDPTCPESSRIGSLTVDTPLIDDPLTGSVYLAKQGDNPFNSLLAIYLVARGPGLIVKLSGHVIAHPDGTLQTVFDDQPELPFSHLHLQLKGGDRAPLINPPACGSYSAHSELTPWSGNAAVNIDSSFAITSGPGGRACPTKGLHPAMNAGLTNPVAGGTGEFNFKLTRSDGEQRLRTLDVSTPPGMAAYLKGVSSCPDAALNAAALAQRPGAAELTAPSCPAASQLGVIATGAGAGPNPFYVQGGKVYLAGPYAGEPLSLAVIVPAVAGPFDLGTVLVRAPVHVDPVDAHLSVHTELPTILQGIPLDIRSVDLSTNRPHFILGPTDCSAMQITARALGTAGAIADLANPFQMVDCASLAFKPKLSLALKGATHRRAHPKLIATLTARPGDANIARAQVKLPPAAFLDQSHIATVCTRVQFAARQCPAGSVYGTASATTPILAHPLQGNVYLRSSSHELPDLVAELKGPESQPIVVELAGKPESVKGALRNTFEAVPDAPVDTFRLQLFGGKRGLIEMSSGFCAHPRATAKLDAQNGRVFDTNPKVRARCGKSAKPKRKSGGEGRGR